MKEPVESMWVFAEGAPSPMKTVDTALWDALVEHAQQVARDSQGIIHAYVKRRRTEPIAYGADPLPEHYDFKLRVPAIRGYKYRLMTFRTPGGEACYPATLRVYLPNEKTAPVKIRDGSKLTEKIKAVAARCGNLFNALYSNAELLTKYDDEE